MKKINDIIINPSALKILLILESPYKMEIIHNHPLAGSSGLFVTKYFKKHVPVGSTFKDFNYPIGCEIINNNVESLGIMNISLYPLDRTCHPCNVSERECQLIDAFDLIRRNPNSKKRMKACYQSIEKKLFANFTFRINKINEVNKNIVFVPCGKLATNYLEKLMNDNKNVIKDIPHPSLNGWNKLDNQGFIKGIKCL